MAKKSGGVPKWVRNLIGVAGGGVFAAVFAWHFYAIFEMTKTVEVNSYRTKQIAEALPEMGRFVAREELNKPIDGVLVATRPIQVNDSWLIYAYIADSIEGQQQIFTLDLTGEYDVTPAYSLIGAVQLLTGDHSSFAEMVAWSADVDEPATLPSIFDVNSSFIFRGSSYGALQDYLAEHAGPPTTISLEHRPTSWPAVLIYTNDDIANALYELQEERNR